MTFQPKARYLPDDLKAYSAPRPRVAEYALMALAACLALVAYLEPQPRTFEAETGQAVAAAMAPMPAATPIFEPAHALGRLSSPVQCAGRSKQGLWIAQEGDRKRTGRRCI